MNAPLREITCDMTPGDGLRIDRMPGHWLLAHLGKRVLRPGGIELTRVLLDRLAVGQADDVVEFAPGLGVTARLTLARGPHSYRAVDRDPIAAAQVHRMLEGLGGVCSVGSADGTGLDAACASVVYGEAMLSMQTAQTKDRIVAEAARLLRPGGRYGIHELCLRPEDTPQATRDAILAEMTEAVRVGVRPLTANEWSALLRNHGFSVTAIETAPFRLLEPRRVVQDEGLSGALRFASRIVRSRAARARVLQMRRVFRRHAPHLAAIMIVAEKRH